MQSTEYQRSLQREQERRRAAERQNLMRALERQITLTESTEDRAVLEDKLNRLRYSEVSYESAKTA